MATRMNPTAGRYFNSPQFAQAFSNLAGAFGPPGADEMLGYEKLRGQRFENQSVQDAWGQMTAPGATPEVQDRFGIAATLFGRGYNPTSSNRAVDTAAATQRYGYDTSAATSLANNAADNARAMETARLGVQGNVVGDMMDPNGRNAIDPAFLSAIFPEGVPGVTPAMPVAPSETQAMGSIIAGLSPEEQRALGLAGVETETIVDGTGRPTFATPFDALGQEAYVNQGGKAAAELYNYQTPDGRSGTAILDPNTQTLFDAATRQPLPEGTATAKIEGASRSDAFGATPRNISDANTVVAEANFGLTRSRDFRLLLEQNPGILGIPGRIRSFAQDVGQAAVEMGAAFGNEGTLGSLEDVRRLADTVAQTRGYDPAFARAAALALEMAYMDAKMQDPSGEVNVRELERNLSIYDGGIAGNARVLAALDNLDSRLLARRDIYARQLRDPAGAEPALPGSPGAGAPPPPAAAAPRARNPQTGEEVEWNGQAWTPVQ